MSIRARHSRSFASLLTSKAKVAVIAQFDRSSGCYVLCWQAGPTVAAMSSLAREHIGSFSSLRTHELLYLRTVDAAVHLPDGSWVAKPVAA